MRRARRGRRRRRERKGGGEDEGQQVDSPVRSPLWAGLELLDKDAGAVDCGLEYLAWCLFLGITTGKDGDPGLVSAAPVGGRRG